MLPKAVVVSLLVGASTLPAALAAAPVNSGSDGQLAQTGGIGLQVRATPDDTASKSKPANDEPHAHESDHEDHDSDLDSNHLSDNDSHSSADRPSDKAPKNGAHKLDASHSRNHLEKGGRVYLRLKTLKAKSKKEIEKLCDGSHASNGPHAKECELLKKMVHKETHLMKQHKQAVKEVKETHSKLKKIHNKNDKAFQPAMKDLRQAKTKELRLTLAMEKVIEEDKTEHCPAAIKHACDGKDKTPCQHVKTLCATAKAKLKKIEHKQEKAGGGGGQELGGGGGGSGDKNHHEQHQLDLNNNDKGETGSTNKPASGDNKGKDSSSGGHSDSSNKDDPSKEKSGGHSDSPNDHNGNSGDHKGSGSSSSGASGKGPSKPSDDQNKAEDDLEDINNDSSVLKAQNKRSIERTHPRQFTARDPSKAGDGFLDFMDGALGTSDSPSAGMRKRDPSHGGVFHNIQGLSHSIGGIAEATGHVSDLATNLGSTTSAIGQAAVSAKQSVDAVRGNGLVSMSPYAQQAAASPEY